MTQTSFQIRGVVEGFYGVFYTFPERNDLIRFIGQHGYNYYIYGPKNDRQHRTRWWEPYPSEVMAQFEQTLALAQASGVTFCYALAPITYSGEAEFALITAKLRAFFDLGVRAFAIFMDDIAPMFDPLGEAKNYQRYAELHIDLGNRLYAWLQTLSEECSLHLCPVDYYGSPPFSNYLRALGAGLHPDIDIFYTGLQVCSPTISATDAAQIEAVLRRKPLIWDNYPVNDLAMRSELHIGPIRGRSADLGQAVRGVVVNPMNQAEASKIALLTFANYFRDPAGYDPLVAWEWALREIGGGTSYPALRLFAEHALASCLLPTPSTRLESLAQAVLAPLQAEQHCTTSAEAHALRRYLEELDEACYLLKYRMDNLALRDELLPWIEALECWIWLGKRAMLTLELRERGEPFGRALWQMEEVLQETRSLTRRIAGDVLLPLAQAVLEQVMQDEMLAEG